MKKLIKLVVHGSRSPLGPTRPNLATFTAQHALPFQECVSKQQHCRKCGKSNTNHQVSFTGEGRIQTPKTSMRLHTENQFDRLDVYAIRCDTI